MSRGCWKMLTSVPVSGLSLPQSWATTHFLRPHALLLALPSGHTPGWVFLSASLFRSRDSWLLPPPEEEEAGIESEAPSPRLKCLRKITAVPRNWKKAAGARAQRWRRKGWSHWQVCSWACLLTRYLSSGQDMALSFRESQHKTVCFEEWWETLSPIYTLLFQDIFSLPKNPPFTLYFLHNP